MVRIVEMDFSGSVPLGCVRQSLKSDSWNDLFIGVGQRFPGGAKEFRIALRKYSLVSGYDFKYRRNDKFRVTAGCVNEGCSWEIHAFAKFNDESLFHVVKYVPEHSCFGGVVDLNNPNVTKKLIKELYYSEIKGNPGIRPGSIIDSFKRDYGFDIGYHYVYRGIKAALKEIYGDAEQSFSYLPWFADSIVKNNPGSCVVLDVNHISTIEDENGSIEDANVIQNNKTVFESVFVSYEASIHGFNYCRPLIFLDGTFLTSKFKGCLLAATAKDGDNGFFPLAYAIVSGEDDANWLWFLQKLKPILNPNRNLVFVSDRHSGLLKGVDAVFPASYHGFCLWHLKNNLRRKLPPKSKSREYYVYLLERCAYATDQNTFRLAYDELICKGGPSVKKFMESIEPQHWANLYFPSQRFGVMTSSVAESFNAWIRQEKSLPITGMMDRLRIRLMNKMSERHEQCKRWTNPLCPKIHNELKEKFEICRTWCLTRSSEYVYEVHSDPSHLVVLDRKSCTCLQWQIYGIPCAHAVAAIHSFGAPVDQFVDVHYTFLYYRSTYAHPIIPVPSHDMPKDIPENLKLYPPDDVRVCPGRPKKKRIPSAGEVRKKKKLRMCNNCNKLAYHNAATCKEKI